MTKEEARKWAELYTAIAEVLAEASDAIRAAMEADHG